MTKSQIRDIATSYTTTVFLVIGITGIMMYFKLSTGTVKELHEVLGLVFVLAALFHVYVNWKSMKNYFSKKIFISSFIIVAIISVIFISQNLNKGQNQKGVLMNKVLNASIEDSFKILSGNYDNAIKKLEKQGIKILDSNSISTIAKINKVNPFKVVMIITTK